MITILFILSLFYVSKQNEICVEKIFNILNYKEMKTNKSFIYQKTISNDSNEGSIYFWLKVNYSLNETDNKFKWFSLSNQAEEIIFKFSWKLNYENFIPSNNEINIEQKNNTWHYYSIDFFKKNNATAIKIFQFYKDFTHNEETHILNSDLNLKNFNVTIGNEKNNKLDNINGEIMDFKFYSNIVSNIKSKFLTSKKEPELLYFIDFLNHPSNSQIFYNSAETNFHHSINGWNINPDINDLNNSYLPEIDISRTNNFIINQPFQFIELPKELLFDTNIKTYQKVIYFNLKINSHNLYSKNNFNDYFIYKRNNNNNENILTTYLNVKNFELNPINHLKKNLNFSFNLKHKKSELCYINYDILNKENSKISLFNLNYLLIVIDKNLFSYFTLLTLFLSNNKSCNFNIVGNFKNNDLHYIGNPDYNFKNLIPKQSLISIRIYEFSYLKGTDIFNENNCNSNKIKISGKLKNSFVIFCPNQNNNLLNRKDGFSSCITKKNCNIRNCEICIKDNICSYCKNGYFLFIYDCVQIFKGTLYDVFNKKIISGKKLDLKKIDNLNLRTINKIYLQKNKINVFNLYIKNNNLIQKTLIVNNNFSNFIESNENKFFFSFFNNEDILDEISIKLIYNNTDLPDSNLIFDFQWSNIELYFNNYQIDCSVKKKSINFPCELCKNMNFKIINNEKNSICKNICPKNNFFKNNICYEKKENHWNSFLLDYKNNNLFSKSCISQKSVFCNHCKNDYFLNYLKNGLTYCENCQPNCSYCYGDLKNNCLNCKKNWVLFNNQCIDSCPNFYLKKNKKCKNCIKNCKKCKDEKSCLICKDKYFLKYVSNNLICIKCSKNCKNCTIDNSFCTSCEEGYELKNKKCEKKLSHLFFRPIYNKRKSIKCDECIECFSNKILHCENCEKCKKNCLIQIIKTYYDTLRLDNLDFEINLINTKNYIEIYEENKKKVEFYIQFFKGKIFIKFFKNLNNYGNLKIKINENLNIRSKNCVLKNYDLDFKNKKIEYNLMNKIFFIIRYLIFGIYLLAIICIFYFSNLTNILIKIYKFFQFFKYIFLTFEYNDEIKNFVLIVFNDNLLPFDFFNYKELKNFLKIHFSTEPFNVFNPNLIFIKLLICILLFLITFFLEKINKYYKFKNKLYKNDIYEEPVDPNNPLNLKSTLNPENPENPIYKFRKQSLLIDMDNHKKNDIYKIVDIIEDNIMYRKRVLIKKGERRNMTTELQKYKNNQINKEIEEKNINLELKNEKINKEKKKIKNSRNISIELQNKSKYKKNKISKKIEVKIEKKYISTGLENKYKKEKKWEKLKKKNMSIELQNKYKYKKYKINKEKELEERKNKYKYKKEKRNKEKEIIKRKNISLEFQNKYKFKKDKINKKIKVENDEKKVKFKLEGNDNSKNSLKSIKSFNSISDEYKRKNLNCLELIILFSKKLYLTIFNLDSINFFFYMFTFWNVFVMNPCLKFFLYFLIFLFFIYFGLFSNFKIIIKNTKRIDGKNIKLLKEKLINFLITSNKNIKDIHFYNFFSLELKYYFLMVFNFDYSYKILIIILGFFSIYHFYFGVKFYDSLKIFDDFVFLFFILIFLKLIIWVLLW